MPNLLHAYCRSAIRESRRAPGPAQSRRKAETSNDLVRTALMALTEPLARFLAARMHARYGPGVGLRGYRVSFIGVTTAQQQVTQYQRVREFWQAFVTTAGGTLGAYSVEVRIVGR